MKQRFSSLDVEVIAHELSNSLVTLRLANVYDLSSKIFLLKFAKPDNKKQMIIDSGFRCHLTSFSRATAAAPSPFVARLRKFLKTRRVTKVVQVGTDRIIEIEFTGYRLFLEFYAGGNIILTDNELNILALLRIVPEGQGEEEQRVGSKYTLENRQNYRGIPPLTKQRLQDALQRAVDKGDDGKKQKKKPVDVLRKALAVSITEYPPMLVDHSMRVSAFDSSLKPAEVLENEGLLDHLMRALEEAQRVVQEITSANTTTGYIIAKPRKGAEIEAGQDGDKASRQNLMYDDFHPFRPRQFEDDPTCTFLPFDGFNQTVDEFFSSIEGQKLESRLQERELTAKKRLEAARQDQAKRLGGLQEIQELNIRKAGAIEANVERVQEAMDAVNGLIAQGMDWVEIGKLVELEQKRRNPVAEIIKLPLKLDENTVTLVLGEEELSEDEADETDSDVSESEDEAPKKPQNKKIEETTLKIDINLGITPWANAREYYEQKRSAAFKEQKTLQSSTKALKSTEQKIAHDLRKGLKQEKAILRPVRQQMWFEKFTWFISSDGYMVLGGRDAMQNEILYKKYLKKGDVYVHADLPGASTVVIRNNPSTPDAPIPPSTLSQAGTLAVASSSAWDSKAGMSAWWVNSDQVSKSASTGEFLPTGTFMVRGNKNFLPPAQLLLGFGVMFRISDESKVQHAKHRIVDDSSTAEDQESETTLVENSTQETAEHDGGSDSDNTDVDVEDKFGDAGDADDNDNTNVLGDRTNPLQSSNIKFDDEVLLQIQELGMDETAVNTFVPKEETPEDDGEKFSDTEDEADGPSGIATPSTVNHPSNSQSEKKGPAPLPRGKRNKAKKIAAKYKNQDDEDRQAAQAIIGASLGREKADAEAKARAQHEAELAFQKERRRAQHERTKKETAQHEEARKIMLEEGVDAVDDEAVTSLDLDAFVGTPRYGDEIIEAIPVCAPWAAMSKIKYKAKLQPGAQKKGKAVKEILTRWVGDMSAKGKLDEESRDTERMWPREVELIKQWKPEECTNVVPVSKVRVMMAGGSTGPASKGAQSKGRGGKGSKKQR